MLEGRRIVLVEDDEIMGASLVQRLEPVSYTHLDVYKRQALAAPFVATRGWAQGPAPFKFALTPVFLDNDAAVIDALRLALSQGMGQEIELVQSRTYQEISGALLDGPVDAAWT